MKKFYNLGASMILNSLALKIGHDATQKLSIKVIFSTLKTQNTRNKQTNHAINDDEHKCPD